MQRLTLRFGCVAASFGAVRCKSKCEAEGDIQEIDMEACRRAVRARWAVAEKSVPARYDEPAGARWHWLVQKERAVSPALSFSRSLEQRYALSHVRWSLIVSLSCARARNRTVSCRRTSRARPAQWRSTRALAVRCGCAAVVVVTTRRPRSPQSTRRPNGSTSRTLNCWCHHTSARGSFQSGALRDLRSGSCGAAAFHAHEGLWRVTLVKRRH